MIIQTIRKSQIIEQQTIYKPSQTQPILTQTNSNQLYSHAKPILALDSDKIEQKRLPDYKVNQIQDRTTQLQTKSDIDMSRSNLSRMNEEIQGRTQYFARTGKYDSKYAQDRVENFGAGSRLSQREEQPARVRRNSDYLRSSPVVREETYYRPITQQPRPFLTPSYNGRLGSPSPVPRYSERVAVDNFQEQPTFNRKISDDDRQFYDLSDPKDEFKYHASEAKDAVKGQVSQVKEQVRSNVRENVKDAVGTDNYYLLKDVKDATGALASKAKDNVKENVKDVAYGVAGTAIAAGEVVADGARQVKQEVKDNTKQAVIATVGHQNFNIMKYITDAIGQLKSNIFGTTPSKDKDLKPITPNMETRLGAQSTNQKLKSPPVMKSQSLNEVSPIQYSQRSFSKGPAEQFGFFWIYGLIAIGFFLVIFQVLK